jgi:hypothetical protein
LLFAGNAVAAPGDTGMVWVEIQPGRTRLLIRFFLSKQYYPSLSIKEGR